jgi:hypothetical protein
MGTAKGAEVDRHSTVTDRLVDVAAENITPKMTHRVNTKAAKEAARFALRTKAGGKVACACMW